MIRAAVPADTDVILRIWLDGSIKAHDFVPAEFWESQTGDMREVYLPQSEVFVSERDGIVEGFMALRGDTSHPTMICGPWRSGPATRNRVRPRGYRRERTMSNEPVAPETKGVTVELLATVDLGPEIEGMAGRQLRMRMVTIEPGGVFGPIHDHKGRPGTVYILQGAITDHRNGVATDYGPGVGWPEDRNTTHWLENRGAIPAVEISVDIVQSIAPPER